MPKHTLAFNNAFVAPPLLDLGVQLLLLLLLLYTYIHTYRTDTQTRLAQKPHSRVCDRDQIPLSSSAGCFLCPALQTSCVQTLGQSFGVRLEECAQKRKKKTHASHRFRTQASKIPRPSAVVPPPGEYRVPLLVPVSQ